MEGAFLYTFTLTDVATTWTECLPLLHRTQHGVGQALQRARGLFPFPSDCQMLWSPGPVEGHTIRLKPIKRADTGGRSCHSSRLAYSVQTKLAPPSAGWSSPSGFHRIGRRAQLLLMTADNGRTATCACQVSSRNLPAGLSESVRRVERNLRFKRVGRGARRTSAGACRLRPSTWLQRHHNVRTS